ncbi:MAG: chemotaxis protein CheB [Rhodocyclaceae bacterium]|nr:chemotaxis protein CheB [Rhodocyclaceae bacterium]
MKTKSSTTASEPAGDMARAGEEVAAGAEAPLPIVGIGASAGGLEALEQFFRGVPAHSGLAFVVVQHLDPNHKGILPELLQRATPMEVSQAKNRMPVKRDCVYVIPPNKDMSILNGVLHLFDLATPRGLHLPIDFFLRSLASDRQHLAVGVILSGMGSDGTLGLRAIKEKAGLALAQEPASAKFDAMPRSAMDAGLADIVAAPQDMPARVLAWLRQTPGLGRSEPELEGKSLSALEKVVILLRIQTGHDFSEYKRSTLYRRVERRMGIHQIERIADYVRFLRENPQEVELLFKELLIGVTSFFRDPEAWAYLGQVALPALMARRAPGTLMRAWVPACSTGEEAYSLAIAFKEALEKMRPQARLSLQIYATDLDAGAIDTARQGYYPPNIEQDVSPERLSRYFVADERGYRVGKEIREMLIFAPQNIIMDPPFTKLDFLSCRNLLIYLEADLQKKLLPLFHYSLNPDGILFLGSAETIGNATDLFAPLEAKARLYTRLSNTLSTRAVEFPTRQFQAAPSRGEESRPAPPAANLQTQADQFLLRRISPAAVLANGNGDIVYINGRTGKYLEAASGKANWNIYAMAREGLRHELAGAFQRVTREKGAVSVEGVRIEGNGGSLVNLRLEMIEEAGSLQGLVMIVFMDAAAPPTGKPVRRRLPADRDNDLALELQRAHEQLQTVREEMQSSQEELKSANEELQSTNEELQSTNEELTTSKEEMQSLNEELQTVNAELQSKVDDLSRASNDMKNLLDSTDIATVFLDGRLHVRRFTSAATRIVKLIPSDVGRPLSDIVTDLDYPGLQADAQEVLRTLMYSSKDIAARDGRHFTVRIMPYRTTENMIDGVVITFMDISTAKRLEAELRRNGEKS